MSSYTPITDANAESFLRRRVIFNYGAEHGTRGGFIVDRVEKSEWGVQLIAKGLTGEEIGISGFSTVGIGAYLADERRHIAMDRDDIECIRDALASGDMSDRGITLEAIFDELLADGDTDFTLTVEDTES